MSIKPPIKCPPDYSVLCFRLTECKKAGIVKGITTQLAVDLQDMFVPVTNYEERTITLKAGQTKKIDVSSIGEHWPLQESYQFVVDPAKCGINTEHIYTLYDENLTLIESFSFMVTTDFVTNLNAAIQLTSSIKNLLTFTTQQFSTNGQINVEAIAKGTKYRHVFAFDTTGMGGYFPFPYLHPGNLVTAKEKYKYPRVKLMMLYPDYYKTNVLSNCNCIDASGDMKSNKKWIEYAYEDQYQAILNPNTPIIAQPLPLTNTPPGGTQWTWNQSSLDHIGYHFKVGDMIASTSSSQPLLRGVITDIQGYFFQVDTSIGDYLSTAQSMSHVYSPNEVKWRKMGDFYVHTSAQDVVDTDYLYIETLWLRNPHQYDLPVKILLAS